MATQLSLADGLRHWWKQSDHYDWFGDYLQARGLQKLARGVTSTAAAGLAAVCVAVMFSADGPSGLLHRSLAWASIALMVACAAVRLAVWPTKRQSVILILTLNLAIALFCQVQTTPLIGVVGATAFALTGVSIACFHSAKYMLYNVASACYVGVAQSLRYVDVADHALILAALGLVLIINISVPFGVQSLVHALGGDVVQSDRDPLTGLLHRRALFQQIEALLRAHPDARYLAMTMLDLDGFKALNDTFGHIAGDEALITVAEALVATVHGRALVGRVGGDEFLVAELADTAEASQLPARLRDVIAELPHAVTASLGTAVGSISTVPPEHSYELIVTLFRLADQAMYEAKRKGGNQIRHTVIDFAESPS